MVVSWWIVSLFAQCATKKNAFKLVLHVTNMDVFPVQRICRPMCQFI